MYCLFVFVAPATTKLGTVWSENLVGIKFGGLLHMAVYKNILIGQLLYDRTSQHK